MKNRKFKIVIIILSKYNKNCNDVLSNVKIITIKIDFSTMMEISEKQKIKLKLGITLKKIILENKIALENNKKAGEKDHKLISSLRKLAAASAVEFAIIQRISSGRKNAEITTLIAIAEGFGMNMAKFFSYFDTVSDIEIQKEKNKIKKRKNP